MSKIKSIVSKIPFAKRAYRKIFKTDNYKDLSFWITKYIDNKNVNVVQIGANDGVSGDPLFDLVMKNELWKVLFVEPVIPMFNKLKNNYGDDSRFIFENAAINENGDSQSFYMVHEGAYKAFPDLSRKYDQIGSFNKDHIVKLSEGKLTDYIEELQVNCLSLGQLFSNNKIESVDLLLIDAEGYDWKILSQLDLSRYQPKIIYVEFCNLSEEDKKSTVHHLQNDYNVYEFRINYFCIKKGTLSAKDSQNLSKYLISAK